MALYPPILATFTVEERNCRIWAQYQDGQGLSDLARHFKLSPQRVYQIVSQFRQHRNDV